MEPIGHAGLCPKPEQVAAIYLGRDEFVWLPAESANQVLHQHRLLRSKCSYLHCCVPDIDGIALVFTWRTTVDVYIIYMANVAANVINENT